MNTKDADTQLLEIMAIQATASGSIADSLKQFVELFQRQSAMLDDRLEQLTQAVLSCQMTTASDGQENKAFRITHRGQEPDSSPAFRITGRPVTNPS